MTVDYPEAQHEQFLRDNSECVELYGQAPPPPMTAAEAATLYDEMIHTNDCLRDLGRATPDPPSKESTIEAILSTGLPSWDPYQRVDEVVTSMAVLRQIERACPRPGESVVAGPWDD